MRLGGVAVDFARPRFFRGLDPAEPPGRHLAALATWFAAALAVVGLILALTIAFSPSVPGPR